MKKFINILLIVLFLLNISFFIITQVQANVSGPIYSAGEKIGDFCVCPVDRGNCVCVWNPPDDPK